MVESPAGVGETLLRAVGGAALEDLAEQPLAGATTQENVLAGRMMITVARRHHDAFDSERHGLVEERGGLIRGVAAEKSAVDGYAETLGSRELDGRDRLVVHTFHAHRLVVTLTKAIQVDGESQVFGRLVVVDVLWQKNRVRAQIDKLLARHDAGDDLRHLFVDERLATGDGHHGGATLINGAQRVLDTHAFLQSLFRVVDLAAPGAGQVALEQRLQHQHQRITLVATQSLAGNVLPDLQALK